MTEPIDVALEEHKDPRARLIAVCAVLTTLAAAVVGYMQSEALKESEAAEVEAQQLSAAALAESDRSSEQSWVQIELFMRQQLSLRSAALASELRRFSSAPEEELRLEERISNRLAKTTAQRARKIGESSVSGIEPIDPAGPEGPDRDLLFPTRFLSTNGEQAIGMLAQSDAATEYAQARGDQVTAYIAILAILAVTLYLFGFSLTPYGRPNRPLFATTAAVLGISGLVWAIATTISPPAHADDSAADAYARAETAQLVEDYDGAVEAYGQAIGERPNFALAYKHRAIARFFAGSPQAGETFGVNLTSPSALRGAIGDYERAQELGLDDSTIFNDLAFSYLSLGLQEQDQDRIAESISLSQQAAELRPDDPQIGPAIGYLALGYREQAFELFEKSAQQIAYADVEAGELRDYADGADWMGAAMTDLELFAAHYPEQAEDVIEIKELLVNTVQRETAGLPANPGGDEESTDQVDILDAYGWVGGVGLSVAARQLDPGRERTWVEWYRKDAALGWFAMPQASGSPSTRPDRDALGWQEGRDTWFVESYYLRDAFQPVCLPPAEYRAELYVDGRLADTGEFESRVTPLVPAVDRAIGYRLCRPTDWRPASKALPGLVNGFISDDGRRGIYVIRLGDTGRLGGLVSAQGGTDAAVAPILDEFEHLLRSPSRPQFERNVDTAFLGTDDEVVQDHHYDGGRLRLGVSRQNDDSLFIGLVFGPEGYWRTSSEPEDIFLAISERG